MKYNKRNERNFQSLKLLQVECPYISFFYQKRACIESKEENKIKKDYILKNIWHNDILSQIATSNY